MTFQRMAVQRSNRISVRANPFPQYLVIRFVFLLDSVYGIVKNASKDMDNNYRHIMRRVE